MNKRALILGILVAFLASVISQALLRGQKAIASDVASYTPYFLSPLFSMLIQATSMLAWAIPGFYVGYLCKNKPAQHGAMLGATYGALLGVAVFAMQASELSNTDSMLILATSALAQIAKYSVLFALAAPAGYLLAAHRANL
ncbi:hypothetical protein HNE05_03595 [Aquipseudomonas campi]|uniref:Uncharacterized protein n=1 Tax=Aquipseudomonas campi TaxID=2731681 RepID=A0A6M8FES1_9GAMM|nr:hypothetical protein [Pseudomonas campi]QKE62479.1 hypothetical protein HNE05_03595 [Pseudomonas campi]